jgi:hypothetical protein
LIRKICTHEVLSRVHTGNNFYEAFPFNSGLYNKERDLIPTTLPFLFLEHANSKVQQQQEGTFFYHYAINLFGENNAEIILPRSKES